MSQSDLGMLKLEGCSALAFPSGGDLQWDRRASRPPVLHKGQGIVLSGGVIMLLYSTGPESNPSIVPVCIPEVISSARRHSRTILCAQVFGEVRRSGCVSLGSFRLRYALE